MSSSSTLAITFTSSSSSSTSSSTLSSSTSTSTSLSSSTSTSTFISISTVSTPATINTITVSAISVPTTSPTITISNTPHGRLNPGTIVGLVIGGLAAGLVFGAVVTYAFFMIRRRLRHRKSPPSTQPEDRLMHLERIRGHAAPPLREPYAIQNLPPSKNIRVLNWLARTQSAGPPSVSQHTMSERSTHEDSRYHPVGSGPPPPSGADGLRSESTSESHYSQHSARLAPITESPGGQPNSSELRLSSPKVD